MTLIRHARGINRRSFLRGLASGAALAPFVPILPSVAGVTGAPRRLLVFFTANGTVPDAWDPTPDFTMGEILAPLEHHKERLLLLSGLRLEAGFHGDSGGHAAGINGCLTGRPGASTGVEDRTFATGISVDQHIAEQIGGETKFPSLQFGVQSYSNNAGEAGSAIAYSGSMAPILAENDPAAMFDRVFGDFDPSGELDPQQVQDLADRQSVIDLVSADLERLEARLGAEDRVKVEAHLDAIREIESALGQGAGDSATAACSLPSESGLSESDCPAQAKNQIDLMVMALACDLTRVASVQLGPGGSNITYDWLADEVAATPGFDPEIHRSTNHHGFAHQQRDPDPAGSIGRQGIINIENWSAQQMAYLLDQLDSIPEGDGSLLDNTIVLWANELAEGGHHGIDDMRFVMTGGGYYSTGRHVHFDQSPTHYNDLLLSLCHAMGLTELTSFGEPAYCSGSPLSGLV